MTLKWLSAWWNLVFLIPFALALAYLAMYVLSGVTFGDADADADADADVDADSDADTDHDTHGGVLVWLGVGRMPLSLILMLLLLSWGFVGFIVNQFLREAVPGEWLIPLISLPVAGCASILVTRFGTRLLSRILPTEETYAHKRTHLLGEVGQAVYPIDERFGMAAVRDDAGNLFQVPCRVEPGRPPLAKGTSVLLVSYDATHNIFHVMPDDDGLLMRRRGDVKKGVLP